MASPKDVLKNVGPKLVPFFKTVAIYFVLFVADTSPSWFACLIKCLPIVSLVIFVLLNGMSLGDQRHSYSRRILTGLVICAIGDAFLIYGETHFVHGMVSFGLGHLAYVSAFGFEPLNPAAGVSCAVVAVIVYATMLPGLEGVLVPGVAVYFFLLGLMAWRSIARVQLFENLWTWTKLCSCAGGIMFCVSDFFVGINKFIAPLTYAQVLIMVPYYAAQLGIALSVVDSMQATTTGDVAVDVKSSKSSVPINPVATSAGTPLTQKGAHLKMNYNVRPRYLNRVRI